MHNYSTKMENLESAHLYAPNLVKRDVGVTWQNNFHTYICLHGYAWQPNFFTYPGFLNGGFGGKGAIIRMKIFKFFLRELMALPHLKNPKVKATSHFGYLVEHDVESVFFLIKSFTFDYLMPFFFYYFLSLGNQKKIQWDPNKEFMQKLWSQLTRFQGKIF